MTDAFIYDHVRTPRGRGRPDGSLHEISSVQLAKTVLRALADRSELDTSLIDDVIMGCAQPVGEQGGNIARAAVLWRITPKPSRGSKCTASAPQRSRRSTRLRLKS